MNNNLNHPFFIYPRGFMSEYNEYPLYRQEVSRLYEFIGNLENELYEKHCSKEILIPFIIGSPMEDSLAKSNTDFENIFQYSQLFPNYISNFITYNTNKKFIQIIIVSPDNIFSPNTTHKPYFTLFGSYEFVNNDFNEYTYIDDYVEIKVNIFNCPMPCVETRTSLVIKYQQMIDEINNNSYNITTYKQNQTDINFINSFYSSLDKLFNYIQSLPESRIKTIINSWVSFKNLDGYSDNYKMFPNLLKLANKYNIIATEWDFIDNMKFTKIVSNYRTKNKNFNSYYINYVDQELDYLNHDILMLKLVINFNYKNGLFQY